MERSARNALRLGACFVTLVALAWTQVAADARDIRRKSMFEVAMEIQELPESAEKLESYRSRVLVESLLAEQEAAQEVDVVEAESSNAQLRFSQGMSRRQMRGFRKSWGLQPPDLETTGPSIADINATAYRYESVVPPNVVDWRSTFFMTPMLSQYRCQSCWSLAAVDAIAIMWAIRTNSTPVVLSPQQVSDCGTKSLCSGGWPEWAFDFALANGGLSSNDVYPYRAAENATCQITPGTQIAAMITGWERVPALNPAALLKAVAMQPVVAFVDSRAFDFQTYKSQLSMSIYNGNCGTEINHVVLVVGYNLTGGYWILKNSYPRAWGAEGYMYLAIDGSITGKCGLHMMPALYPTFYPWVAQQPKTKGKGKSKSHKWKDDDDDDEDDDGRWWKKTDTSYLGMDPSTLCNRVINPCGAGSCYTAGGGRIARCNCPSGFVEQRGTPTSKCVPASPCSAYGFNPCGAGTCRDRSRGTYSCTCNANYVIGATADGNPTCVPGQSPSTYVATYGNTCGSIASAFSISTATLSALNPTLDCVTFKSIRPGSVVIVKGQSSAVTCTSTYTVATGDTCSSIINTFFFGSSYAFSIANPGVSCSSLYTEQQICVGGTTVAPSAPSSSLICGKSLITTGGETCQSVATANGISLTTLQNLNPALNCSRAPFLAGLQICTASIAASPAPVNCTETYVVKQGDNCVSIWLAANLTQQQFFFINPGIMCQAPYLRVGQQVCTDSPSLDGYFANLNVINFTVSAPTTLNDISVYFSYKCRRESVTPDKLVAFNNFPPGTSTVPAGTLVRIPCDNRPGDIDCGCAPSLLVCGADGRTYLSRCDAICNYASPATDGACSGCRDNCANRAGLAPTISGCGALCPYPTWKPDPVEASQIVESGPGMLCRYGNQTCENVCTATAFFQGGSQATMSNNYWKCFRQCLCCSRVPCGGPTCPAAAGTGSTCTTVNGVTTCTANCAYWNSYWQGVTAGNDGFPS